MEKKNIIVRGWKAFVHRILKIHYGKMHYLRLDIDIDDINHKLDGFNLPVKELVYEDFLLGNKNEFNVRKLATIKERLNEPGYKAYGLIEDGRLIYSTWVSLERLGQSTETRKYMLNPDEGLLEDSFCDYCARGRGLHGKMNLWRIRKIHELGKTKVLALVLDGNTPAMKVQKKCGFKEVGTYYEGLIFGIKFNTLDKELFDKSAAVDIYE